MKKHSFAWFITLFPAVLFMAALIMLATASAPPVAGASSADFDVIFPGNDYIPASDAALTAASANFVAVYDRASECVFVIGALKDKIPLGREGLCGMWLAGDRLLLEFESDSPRFMSVDLSSRPLQLTAADLPSPANISYITSDGNNFYAKSTASMTVYASDLTMSGSVTDAAVIGDFIVAADGKFVFVFSQYYGEPIFKIYEPATGATTEHPLSFNPLKAVAASVIYASDGETVSVLSKTDGSVVFTTDIACGAQDSFAAYGDALYFASGGKVNVYVLDAGKTSLRLERTLSMAGSETDRLSSPTDVVEWNGKTVVADAGNSRLLSTDGEFALSTDDAPLKLAVGERGLYFASDSAVYLTDSENVTAVSGKFREGTSIIDIAYSDALYVLTDEGLGVLAGGGLTPLSIFGGGLALACAENGEFLYALTATHVLTLSKAGDQIIPPRPHGLNAAADIAVDYECNLYIACSDGKVAAFRNEVTGLIETAEHVLASDYYSITPTALSLDGEKSHILADEGIIARLDVSAVSRTSFVPTTPPDVGSPPAVAFYSLSADCLAFSEPKRFDTAVRLSAGDVLTVLHSDRTSGYSYAVSDGKFLYVPSSALAQSVPAPIGKDYSASKATPIYAYPGAEAADTLTKGEVVRAEDNACGIDGGKWLRIRRDGNLFFVAASDLTPYEPPQPETEKLYGKAKALRIGGTVDVFSAPSGEAECILKIRDGEKVEILEKVGEYYKIEVNGVTGYIAAERIQMKGLTGVQILAIALSALVLAAGAIVFGVGYYARKKQSNI